MRRSYTRPLQKPYAMLAISRIPKRLDTFNAREYGALLGCRTKKQGEGCQKSVATKPLVVAVLRSKASLFSMFMDRT